MLTQCLLILGRFQKFPGRSQRRLGGAPDRVVEGFHIDGTFGGSLFLGVATSLPEVTATIALCKKKNFDAAYGDIIGSCTFNIIILALADAMSFKTPTSIYNITSDSLLLIIGTAFTLLLLFVSILYIRSKFFKNDIKSRLIIYTISSLLIASYFTYLILATIGVKLI